MRKRPPSTSQTSSGNGDVDAALYVARTLRAEGIHATAIKVGDVSIEMLAVVDTKQHVGEMTMPQATRSSVLDEWGGPEFRKAIETPVDLVDDDDQPAVRA